MSLTVKGQDPENVEDVASRRRGLFYERENERLRREFRFRFNNEVIPGDVPQSLGKGLRT